MSLRDLRVVIFLCARRRPRLSISVLKISLLVNLFAIPALVYLSFALVRQDGERVRSVGLYLGATVDNLKQVDNLKHDFRATVDKLKQNGTINVRCPDVDSLQQRPLGLRERPKKMVKQIDPQFAHLACVDAGSMYLRANQDHLLPRSSFQLDDIADYPLAFNAFAAKRWKAMKAEWQASPLRRQGRGYRVLLVMGLLNMKGFDGSGSFTGDMMQWADTAAALAVLGAQVDVFCGESRDVFLPAAPQSGMPLSFYSTILADYGGLLHLHKIYKAAGREHELLDAACKLRILDEFGTEESFLRRRNRTQSGWIPRSVVLHANQILTFEPHHIQQVPPLCFLSSTMLACHATNSLARSLARTHARTHARTSRSGGDHFRHSPHTSPTKAPPIYTPPKDKRAPHTRP